MEMVLEFGLLCFVSFTVVGFNPSSNGNGAGIESVERTLQATM